MLFGFAQSNGGVDRVQAHEAGRGKDEEAHLEKHFFRGGVAPIGFTVVDKLSVFPSRFFTFIHFSVCCSLSLSLPLALAFDVITGPNW